MAELYEKPKKVPQLSGTTKLLSFDIETNGLHGAAFAVAGILMQADGTVVSEFLGRSPLRKPIDPWVAENVLPALENFPPTHKSARALREAFWQWYIKNEGQADYVLVNNGYPVEYRFLLQCQEDNLPERYWQHPFPMLDLASLLLQVGVKTSHDKKQFTQDLIGDRRPESHNPHWDTWVALVAAFKALRASDQLND